MGVVVGGRRRGRWRWEGKRKVLVGCSYGRKDGEEGNWGGEGGRKGEVVGNGSVRETGK